MPPDVRNTSTAAVLLVLLAASAHNAAVGVTTGMPYVEARPILEALREDLLPAELRSMTAVERETAWPGWVARHDAAIRHRVELGDEDSIVNFLLFGTTFTKLARATERELAQVALQPDAMPEVIRSRMDALMSAVEAPGADERLQFAREIVARKATGNAEVRRYLTEAVTRVSYEIARLAERRLNDPRVELDQRLTRFRDRGLSSDTSLFVDFAIEQALQAIAAKGLLDAGRIRRVAIVGPGLDFIDKHAGYDFYAPQTIQPFAVIDSLLRLGLAAPGALRVATFDLSTRVNHHLQGARDRARAGQAYVVQLPRALDPPWTPPLAAYWERLGDRIGEAANAAPVPAGAGRVQMRAVSVRPDVVLSVVPHDLNVVLQRLAPLPADERFDLVIATNVLAYYGVFEQSLALANLAAMMRPGGMFLTNNGVFELPGIPMAWIGETDVTYMTVPDVGDTIDRLFWYQRM